MRCLRAWVLFGLLALFLHGAWVQQHPGRVERVHPPAEHHWSRPATPQEAKAAELTRQLEQWRTEKDAEVIR